MRSLIRPTLFLIARLGLLLSVAAWIAGSWYDIEFLAHGLRTKLIVDQSGLTFTRSWTQPGGQFGGGPGGAFMGSGGTFSGGFGSGLGFPNSDPVPDSANDEDAETSTDATPQTAIESDSDVESDGDDQEGFLPAILSSEPEPEENTGFASFDDLIRLIQEHNASSSDADGATPEMVSNTVELSLDTGGPAISWLDPGPEPDYRSDSRRGWIEVQPTGMIFYEPASERHQWLRIISEWDYAAIPSGLHLRHCGVVAGWCLFYGILIVAYKPRVDDVKTRQRRIWLLAILSTLVAAVIFQNGIPSREDRLVAELSRAGADIYYERGHAAIVEMDGSASMDGEQHITFHDDDLANAAGLLRLLSLYLYDTKVTDRGLSHLIGAEQLQELVLTFDGHSQITDASLKHIGTLTSLRSLTLSGVPFTDSGLAELRTLTGLKELIISDARITDAGLVHIRSLKDLRSLEIDATETITREAVYDLQRFLPDCRIRCWY